MYTLPPVPIALIILLALAAVGSVSYLIRRIATFRSYQDLAEEARQIAKALRGTVFRDGGDLVISGSQGCWPVVVRFSHAQTMPGVDIRMQAPASFTMWVTPRSRNAKEGRAALRTTDARFDTRFAIRSDHPTQANLLLAGRHVLPALQELCANISTSLAITSGSIELMHEAIPRPNTARTVLGETAGMAKMADCAKTIPGAEHYKIKPIRKERHILGRLTIAAGMLTAILTVAAATRTPVDPPPAVSQPQGPAGIPLLDAARIPGLNDYRLANPEDFDLAATAWLRGNHVEPSARVSADFTGQGQEGDVAYVLVDKQGDRRLVLLAGGSDRYDIKYPHIGAIARIPKAAVSSTQWAGKAPRDVDGDGLLIVRRLDDTGSGLVLFVKGPQVISAVPANYQTISLQ